MEQQANKSLRLAMSGLALATGLLLGGTALAQRAGGNSEEEAPPTNIDAQTGKAVEGVGCD